MASWLKNFLGTSTPPEERPIHTEVEQELPGTLNKFQNPGLLRDNDLTLKLVDTVRGFPRHNISPAYDFRMVNTRSGRIMGRFNLRISTSIDSIYYYGQIGYGVDHAYRGHRYAARSLKLIFPFALAHGVNPLWVTCNPDNTPSRRSLEIAGGEMMEIIDIPAEHSLYRRGERQKCRFRFDLRAMIGE